MHLTPPSDPMRMTRRPAVAGSFYPASPAALRSLVDRLVERATLDAAAVPDQRSVPGKAVQPDAGGARPGRLRGLLVPHAGLEWSGTVAAASWRLLARAGLPHLTVVMLGTNHSAWLSGVGIWPAGAWRTPLGDVPVDGDVAAAIERLGSPFEANPGAHLREHSIEVQLPFIQALMPEARIVPLAVSAGTGVDAIEAGDRLGRLVTSLDRPEHPVVVAISTDLAHYPAHRDAVRVTESLLPAILGLDPAGVAATERRLREASIAGLVCGMCGIEPTVLGLAALRGLGATQASVLAAATSADAGGPADRTVGYLAVAVS
jgi:MEMO1 family protein